jgi:hypothetical protein
VPHDQRRYAKALCLNAVEFAAADAGALNVHNHLIVTGDDLVDVLHFHHTEGGEHECLHIILRAVLRYLIVTLQVRALIAY